LGFMVGAGILFQVARGDRTTIGQSLFLRDGSPSISLQEATSLSRQIALFTVIVEGLGWFLLTVSFWPHMNWNQAIWHGLFHSVSAFCNAGFDLNGNYASLIGYRASYAVNISMAILVVAGALSFLVVREAVDAVQSIRHKVRRPTLSLDAKLVLAGNLVIFVIAFLTMLVFEWRGMLAGQPWGDRVLGAGFQALVGRTSGFTTVDWAEANSITEFIWLAMMMIGGASGSTTGGVKIATVAVIFIAVLSTFRGEGETEVYHRRIPAPLLMRAMSIVAAFLLLHFAGTIFLATTEFSLGESDAEFNNLLFESMSALGTVGLSTGIAQEASEAGKILMCVLMFVGRLGPLTLGYALQMRSHPRRYRYSIGEVRIG
ncbi:MAG: potassium transporter TrkG, partial [Thermomicrobiales bacterium]